VPIAPVAAKLDTATEAQSIGSIRVNVDKIDLLMNMVGELVITQSMLGLLDDDSELDAARIARLSEGLSALARNTRSLQENVLRLRSVPVGVVFKRFPRLVHDLGPTIREVDLHGAHAGHFAEGRGDVLDAPVARHAGDPQGGDHAATVA
jgi:two-component system chemotaxis sensor kinase CheA